jgi:hypothetical protein
MAGEQPRALIRPLLCDMPLRMVVVPADGAAFVRIGHNSIGSISSFVPRARSVKTQFKQ